MRKSPTNEKGLLNAVIIATCLRAQPALIALVKVAVRDEGA